MIFKFDVVVHVNRGFFNRYLGGFAYPFSIQTVSLVFRTSLKDSFFLGVLFYNACCFGYCGLN